MNIDTETGEIGEIDIADLGGPIPSSAPVSTTYSPGATTGTEERALQLLGNGVNQEAVASALGVSPSRITQLLANTEFAQAVAQLRYNSLQKHNERDSQYDGVEDRLLDKLEKSLPLLTKPNDILRAITVINGAKRRGHDSPESSSASTNIVNLILPEVITEKFAVNINNQVTKAGEQELLTMPSGNLKQKVEDARSRAGLEAPDS